MNGFGGAGAFSDGKYNITNNFGGTLYEYIGKDEALSLMRYVDEINLNMGGLGTKLYSTSNSKIKTLCVQNNLHLLDASVRHLGTDINYVVLQNLYDTLKDKVDFHFLTTVEKVEKTDSGYRLYTNKEAFEGKQCIISGGRSGSKWMEDVCKDLEIPTNSNRVDIGVRVELPYEVFAHLTDELYESKIIYRTAKYGDLVRTFCMNPKGAVVNENTNGIMTVNGHSYEDPAKQTENTNFALLVAKHFSSPFKDSNGYGESIARLSNMLGGGVIVQRFGDLEAGKRSTEQRIAEGFVRPTLSATPGDLSLVIPKRILDGIIEMVYALDKIAPGTANPDTLLYGVEVKFYNMEVEIDEHLETRHKGLFVIGDCSGITHSLSHASASGVHVSRKTMSFFITLSAVAVMLLYAFPGFLLVKTGSVKADHIVNFSKVLLYVCQPCLVIYTFGKIKYSPDTLGNFGWCFLLSLVLQTLPILLCFQLFRKKRSDVLWRLVCVASVFSNCGFFGVPLLEKLLPDCPEAVIYSSIFALGMNMIGWSLGLYILSLDRKYISLKKIFITPNTIGFLVALPFYFTEFTIPDMLLDAISSLHDDSRNAFGNHSLPSDFRQLEAIFCSISQSDRVSASGFSDPSVPAFGQCLENHFGYSLCLPCCEPCSELCRNFRAGSGIGRKHGFAGHRLQHCDRAFDLSFIVNFKRSYRRLPVCRSPFCLSYNHFSGLSRCTLRCGCPRTIPLASNAANTLSCMEKYTSQ